MINYNNEMIHGLFKSGMGYFESNLYTKIISGIEQNP